MKCPNHIINSLYLYMDFTVKKHAKKEFYEVFSKWLDDHKFPRIGIDLLPELCFVSYTSDNEPAYCMWFYFTDSKLAWLAFPASNKNISFKKRDLGLLFLTNYVKNYAKKKGIKMLFTTSNTDSVVDVLNKAGFQDMDQNVNHYGLIL